MDGDYNFDILGDEDLCDRIRRIDQTVAPPRATISGLSAQGTSKSTDCRSISRVAASDSPAFTPQLEGQLEFERALVVRSPRTPVTRGLIALNTPVFVALGLAGVGWMAADGGMLVAWGSNFGPYTTAGDWWRLLMAMFSHSGVLHLVFNMWALASFGPVVERIYGSTRYASLYVVAGLSGGLASVAWTPAVNSVGASGAIFGILGALLATWFSTDAVIAREVLRPVRASTLIFAAASLVSGLSVNGIDNANHLGGLAAGLFMGLARSPDRPACQAQAGDHETMGWCDCGCTGLFRGKSKLFNSTSKSERSSIIRCSRSRNSPRK